MTATRMEREPATLIGAIMAVIQSALAALVILDVIALDDDQIASVLGVAAAVGALVQSVWTRSRVYSPASMERALAGR